MKRVKVHTAAPPADPNSVLTSERLYTVALGNHVVVQFRSRRHALAFQAEASRFLTDAMLQANIMLADAYHSTRLAWPLLNAKDHSLTDAVRMAEDALDRAASERTSQNQVYMSWKALAMAIAQVRHVALELQALYARRTWAVPRMQAAMLVQRCNCLADALAHYGTDVQRAAGHQPSPYST